MDVTARARRLVAGGLLAPTDSDDPRVLEWLSNVVAGGLDELEVSKIAARYVSADSPDGSSFAALRGSLRLRDDQGRSFFLLPRTVSAGRARAAVLATYILNADTGYATAHDMHRNDFDDTPHSFAEIERIAARQQANRWSYTHDVGFIHRGGGRMATTPMGILMAVPGSSFQRLFGQRGGTTYGDIFVLNIAGDRDPAEVLAEVTRRGRKPDRYGNSRPGSIDLDRLLHHEERHSRQWADKGWLRFITGYLLEQLRRDDSTERDAGLADGGYQ